ncbi:MAG: SDR family oxidoreductase [Chloroflexi bacterium]|nr:SDR family oxidoreductase [Chloroflexota bacterium]
MPITDRVAVIIGAGGQLGPAVAKAFAHAGAKLVLVGTHADVLANVFKDLGFRESRATMHVADARDPAAMQGLTQVVQTRFGHADILLHLAGGFRAGTVLDTPDAVWDELFDVNLRTALYATRAFLPLLAENGWGRVLTISSGVTQAPPPNLTAYVAAKAALEAMTIAVAQEVKDKHITANVVLIRALDTLAERAKQPDKKTGWVKPEEVAATLLFLCSDEAGAITGARIPVFGGN